LRERRGAAIGGDEHEVGAVGWGERGEDEPSREVARERVVCLVWIGVMRRVDVVGVGVIAGLRYWCSAGDGPVVAKTRKETNLDSRGNPRAVRWKEGRLTQ
jgi:hypothetical protein